MFKEIGVVGAGMMGAEIALNFAKAGFLTVLCDINLEFAEKGKGKIEAILDKNIQKGNLDPDDKVGILDLVHPSGNFSDLGNCDLIIEAVFEDTSIKFEVYKKLSETCKKDAIIASNTSSISITKLASGADAERAEFFIGTHFNSPASVMKLVEVIPGLLTSDETVDAIMSLLSTIGKEPVKVKDVVGFALNRIFHCMYLEACRLVEEGVCSVEDVDKVCRFGLGHPLGVFKLLDLTGHDLNIEVDRILFEAYGERFRPSPQIQRLVDAGRLGRKVGKGFYDYNK
jgi:3-hydroxybutyryl-CoA dehydrogenase